MKTVYVLAPANHATGGVEALHQLVDALRRNGQQAFIAYQPAGACHEVHPAYRRYRVELADAQDHPDALIVLPESMFSLASRFRRAQVLIWWLSIDFFYGTTHESVPMDFLRMAYRLLRGRWRPMRSLRQRYQHAAQSEYAAGVLRSQGLSPVMLADYLNDELVQPFPEGPRQFRILYNPKKGLSRTRQIMAALPEVEFVALEGFNRGQLTELLRTSEIYIDFGHHPGKDRMPREAAVNGCIVLTNRRNGAASSLDLPLPESFKIDDTQPGFGEQVALAVRTIRANTAAARQSMKPYVLDIRQQQQQFLGQAAELMRRLG